MSTDANTNTVCNNGFQGKKRKADKININLNEDEEENINTNINEEEENGIDLALRLAPPRGGDRGGGVEWKITKQLTRSDVVAQQNRLLIAKSKAHHITDKLKDDQKYKVYNEGGCLITVVDIDTKEEYKLKFRHWKSNKYYAINGDWHKLVVEKRGLAKKKDGSDEYRSVGLRWDDDNKKLLFSVLN